MNSLKRLSLMLTVSGLIFCLAVNAEAGSLFSLSYSASLNDPVLGPITATGSMVLDTVALGGGVYEIIGLTGTSSDVTNSGVVTGTLGFDPGAYVNGDGATIQGDNLLFPTSSPIFDSHGFNLIDSALAPNYKEINISGNNSGGNDFWQCEASLTINGQIPVFFPVPEPSSLSLMGLGGLGLIVSAYRRRRMAAV